MDPVPVQGDDLPPDAPDPTALARLFEVYDARVDEGTLLYLGQPQGDPREVEREVWPIFSEAGYEVRLQQGYASDGGIPVSPGEFVLVAEPRQIGVDGVPWKNVILFVLTVASTLFVGATQWYLIPPSEGLLAMLRAWPFVAAVLGVLGIHELGHYVLSRYHGVDASLPYFIPVPSLIGTMGAVIRMKGRIPDREALFDIGVAGPIAGLAATVVVTAIGLQLDPLPAQQAAAATEGGTRVIFHDPPLIVIVAYLTGTAAKLQAGTVHPVVFGGWVGAFVTFLNLLPVGQLDGGHIVRSLLGERQETVAAAVPGALFALAAYLYVFRAGLNSAGIWAFWGVFSSLFVFGGPATPIRDEPLDRRRTLIGLATLGLGVLCFTPIPVEIVGV
jgi:membrane-associated protease RseP (regulator of RpoE activity)